MILKDEMKFGFMSGCPTPAEAKATVNLAEDLEFDSLWVGDHVAFPVPILDPLMQLSLASAYTTKLMLGTGVYLLPLRHPTVVAKQVATLDFMTGGDKVIFGVGIGGEFPNEYAACGVDVHERGARLTSSIPALKQLWTGEKVSYDDRFYPFENVTMLPAPPTAGGPPVWCGGRAKAALTRAARIADGYISYSITADMFADALKFIDDELERQKREVAFGTGHLLFMRIDDDYETAFEHANKHLTRRYAMDFSKATKKYCALGKPEDVAETISAYYDAGVRHIVLDLVGPLSQKDEQLTRFAKEVKPLLSFG
ncbi:MAG: TIGR03619 family F420-dependent LLM class oxidoreductase [Pseudomonadales bacterium]|nr:TIGR03619 family F420-dependent LLM class oxidoreductase [Pseudomonadales bacterium]